MAITVEDIKACSKESLSKGRGIGKKVALRDLF
jgi:hypothetical protein